MTENNPIASLGRIKNRTGIKTNESLYSRYFNPTGGLFVKKYPIKYAKYNAINASIILLGATNLAFRFTNPTIPPINTSINPIGTNFGEKHKKKDDLADCYLQAISYTKFFMKQDF